MAAEDSMLNADNVGIAKGRPGGYAVVAPAGTDPAQFADMKKTLPDILKTVASAKSLGYISEDGLEWSTDTSDNSVKDWGGDTVAKEISEFGESLSVTFLESRESVLKTVYGDANVSTSGGTTTVKHNASFTQPHVFVFDSVISATKVKRTIVPVGRIFERDSLTQNSSDPMGYAPTITAMPSAAFEGDVCRDYIFDTTATQAAPEGGMPAALAAADADTAADEPQDE